MLEFWQSFDALLWQVFFGKYNLTSKVCHNSADCDENKFYILTVVPNKLFFCLHFSTVCRVFDYQSKDFSNFLPYNLYLYRNQILMTGYIFPRKIIGSLIGRCPKKFFMFPQSPSTKLDHSQVNDGNFVGKQKQIIEKLLLKWQFWTFDWKLSDEIFAQIAFKVSPTSSPQRCCISTIASDRARI